jgi:hypothetical protein
MKIKKFDNITHIEIVMINEKFDNITHIEVVMINIARESKLWNHLTKSIESPPKPTKRF